MPNWMWWWCLLSCCQVRAAHCMVRLHNMTQNVDSNLCEDAGLPTPPTIQKCGTEDCPHWVPSDWSPCEQSRCFTWNTGSLSHTKGWQWLSFMWNMLCKTMPTMCRFDKIVMSCFCFLLCSSLFSSSSPPLHILGGLHSYGPPISYQESLWKVTIAYYEKIIINFMYSRNSVF